MNLDTFIRRAWPEGVMQSRLTPYVLDSSTARLHIAYMWDIMENIAEGVAFIHDIKVVHRDLKPKNGNQIIHWVNSFQYCIRPMIKSGKSLISVS